MLDLHSPTNYESTMSLHEDAKPTLRRFTQITGIQTKKNVATFKDGKVRVKRASTNANQVQPWRGEPIAVHVPAEKREAEKWYVLPVDWQIEFARAHATDANQHGSHAYECMILRPNQLPSEYLVSEAQLVQECEKAIKKASSIQTKMTLTFLRKMRTGVTELVIETMNEFHDELSKFNS